METQSEQIEVYKVWALVLNIYLGEFMLGYTLAVFNTSYLNIGWTLGWENSEDAYTNLFSTLIPVGVAIGCLITGPSISKYGRRKTYIFTCILYIVGTCILLCPVTALFGIGRMLTGISAGIYGVLAPIYANELTPECMVSKTGAYIAIMSSLGVLFAYAFGLPLPTDSGSSFNYWWVFMFIFPGVVSIYLLVFFSTICIYDTPQYYMEKNLENLAMQSLRQSYTLQGVTTGLQRLKADKENSTSNEKTVNVFTVFFQKKFAKMIRIGFIRVAFFQFSGIFTLLFYSTSVFGEIGGSVFLSRVLTVVFGFILLVANYIFIPVAKCFNRKTIFVVGDLLLALLMLGAGISSEENGGIVVPAVLLLIFVLVFGSTVGSVTWMYLAEILNPQILVVVSMYSWILQIIITVLYPVLVRVWSISIMLFIFAAINALGAAYSGLDMVETRGRMKEEVLKSLNALDENATKRDKIDKKKSNEILIKDGISESISDNN